mmetsp:Transcript_24823/g.70912  ORF Transcript_24823/g.70912 Transcript_24823/m.70912 type:complete len:230 (+) Transcript_24823:2-691(+)
MAKDIALAPPPLKASAVFTLLCGGGKAGCCWFTGATKARKSGCGCSLQTPCPEPSSAAQYPLGHWHRPLTQSVTPRRSWQGSTLHEPPVSVRHWSGLSHLPVKGTKHVPGLHLHFPCSQVVGPNFSSSQSKRRQDACVTSLHAGGPRLTQIPKLFAQNPSAQRHWPPSHVVLPNQARHGSSTHVLVVTRVHPTWCSCSAGGPEAAVRRRMRICSALSAHRSPSALHSSS